MGVVTLVLGGAKSGKSSLAQKWAEAAAPAQVYIATATAGDQEMADRIRAHQNARGATWSTWEETRDLAGALADNDGPGKAILVDCLTLWLSNLMLAGNLDDTGIRDAGRELAQALEAMDAPVFLVANEVGLGIVPSDPISRRYRDLAGWLNQFLAKKVDNAVFIAAGLPLALKGRVPEGA